MNIHLKNIQPKSSSDENDLSILIKELERLLPLFTSSDFFSDLDKTSNENHYTEQLIKYLTYSASSKFVFFNQPTQKDKRSVDLGIYLKADRKSNYIFCIEAKFLPSYDYVTGEYAAIKRFKKCEHGLSKYKNGIPLLENSIVAYVKKESFKNHQAKINKKITELSKKRKEDKFDLTWNKSEQLKETSLTTKFISNHLRIDAPNVKLHHFWIAVFR
jgi:hypothetical protein